MMASMPRDIDLASDNLAQIWDWNAQVPESVVVGVHSMFERCAQHQPTALAVDAWDGKLTYGELNRLSSNLAAYLIREGVGQGKTVPLCFEKSMWTTVAMLAVLKADSSFVLLEPSLPEGRLQIVIEQTNADIVVCSLATGDLSRRLVNRVLCLDSPLCTKLASAVPSGNLGSLVTFEPSSPMYIVYTSGSTGSPKGVIVSHQAHASALHHQTQQLGITAESRIFEFSAYSFDIAIYNTFSALTRGGCLCVPREQDRRNSLAQAITMSSANFVYLTPTVARQISPDSAPTLETVAFIGEALSPRDLEPWQNKVRFVNTYGPSECTTASTINPSTTDIEKSCLIGKGSGMVTWIVDPEDHNVLLPLGAVGELLLEGPLLANGYLGDEAKTSKAFLHDPEWLLKGSCRVPGRRGRLYKTGDLVRYHGHGGDLHFVGRKDNQVKIRGNRVELGEVEYRIAEILSLSSKVVADVITPRGKNSSPILAVFLENDQDVITGSAIVMPVPQDLISNLSNYLPSYMIPNVFFSVNKLPMTSSGKTDRRALREIGQSFSAREIAMAQAASQTVRRSPDSELSRKMQQLWSKVLDLEPDLIGLDDSFLQLGGDSVRAMNLVTVSRAAGLQLTVADIFQRPTLQDVTKSANIIDEEAQRASAQRIEPFSLLGQGLDVESFLQDVADEYQVDSSIILDAFPCTPLQEGLLSLSSMSSGEYVSQNVLELDAQVDIDKFCAAWEQVCVVVDALRTRIVHHRHLGLVQLVMRETIHWFQGTDIKEYLTSDQEQVMGPGSQLSRFALIGDATNGKRYFIWTIHHALYDEWSLSLLLSLASKIYSGSTIAPIPTFQPFIKYIQDQDPSRAALYWEEALNGCECAPFPTLPPSISQPLVDTSVVHQLPHVHRANASGITTATVIRASWALVVASMTNSDDVVFGGTVSGRNVPIADIETVPAPTIATVPVRITLGGSEQLVSELLQTVQSQAIDMVPYEQMGLHRIAKISLDAQQACDFQTLIVIQPEDGRRSKTTFGSWREDLKQQELSTYGLTLEVHLGTDNTTVKASFDSRMIQPWIVDGLLERLAHVMNQLDDIGEKSILADIQVITQEDLSRIWTWNRSVPKTANVSIHEILSHKASTRPTHTAISAWDGEFSYQEMDRLTTVLAARIYELGLAQGSIIPLYFEKSAWANVAMLAVLKAGCAFVLLDTSLPEQRLVEMIRQVSAEFILCSPSTRNTSLRLASRVLEVDEALLSELTRASLTNGSVSLPLVSPDSLAYVLFTSGSTGRPKCVAITHNNVTSAVPEHVERLGYTEETRIYDFASYSFGASLNNAFCALVAGGCLCVPSDEDRRSNLAESLSALKATSVLLTPSIAESLSPESVTSLKTLILGGEAVRPKHVKPWWDRARVLTAYGSSEMTTVATINSQASDPDEVTRIGTGAGGVTWVVDPDNHHVLSVPGSIGELLLEGPLVGSGYLHEPTKTSEVFIEDPKWLLEGSCTVPGRRGRLYKTGDLVRYNQDGSLSYIGRNDQQVKIRGQRVELGEIEFRVHQCFPAAKFVASEVIFPQAHEGNPMIAAFLQMDAGDGANAENEEEDGATILAVSSTVENWLAEQLPIYMVPAVFFALRKLPLLSTGKMNRRMLRAIGNSVSMAEITEVKDGQKVAKRQPGSELEGQIQALWARTLNMEQENIGMDDSFFRLGGDSISAMQVVSGARSKMISLRVVDILRLKTISNLAKSVEAAKNSYTVGRVPEGSTGPTRPRRNKAPSQLSPIQNLYFHLQQDATACFDQYFFLKLNWHVEYEDVVTAISSVIRRHDALRTRFSKNETGTWEQSIIHDDGASSLRLLLETENDASRRATIISDVRSGLDIVNGPIVSGVLFDQGQQALFLTIHHLVIDLVSWRIILQELEDLLTHGVAGIASPSLHFPDWIAMQARYAREHLDPGGFDSQNSQINASYWGMETNANLRSGAAVLEFTLDEHTSSRILGSCNAPLGTQPLEIMISALIHSFSRIFGDRPLPLVFTEGHGREVWDDDIDLSTTVGWFSTIYPVHDLADARNMGIIDIIRHTKDFIRRMPQNGWSHFTSRFADYKLASDFSKDFPVEILFNYIGLYQQLERGDGLFQMANVPAGSHPPSNERVRRFTLFDIDVYVDKGHIHATLESHQDMCHQEKIVKWVAQFEASLRLFATELPGVPSQLTLSDIPMAFTSHHDLQEFYEMSLPQLQLETDDIEHIFPCAPLQEGILLSQAKDPLSYQRWFDVQIDAHDGGPPLTRSEIERAWKAVVKRHGLLRALLVGNIPGSVGTMHVILKDPTPEIIWLNNGDEWKMRSLSGDRLQHRATIIEFSENKVLLRVQMNHAITDGFSQDMLCRDLRNALLGQNSAVSSSYERFIRHLSSQSPTDGLEYWKEQLSNIEPCLLPSSEVVDHAADGVGISSLHVSGLDTERIRTFCSEWDVTPATIVKVAWGLVLSLYTDTSVPAFGNLYSGRDIPMHGVDDMFGPLIGMVPCFVRIDQDKTVIETLKQVQSDYLCGLEYQHASLAEIHRALDLGSSTLFNTLLSYQRQTEEDQIQTNGVTVRAVDNFDPTEYDVTVDIVDAIAKIDIELTFRSGHLSNADQQCLVGCVGATILSILDGPLKAIGQLSLIGKADLGKIWAWNQHLPLADNKFIHDMFEEHAYSQPDALAIHAWDGDMSYRRLSKLSAALASQLRQLGIGHNDLVPVCFEKSMWASVAMLAVLKAGAAFVLLDSTLPESRLRCMVEQVNTDVIISSTSNAQLSARLSKNVMAVGASLVDELTTHAPDPPSPSQAQPNSTTMFAVFTSGSTGTPKGVLLTHTNFATALKHQAGLLGFKKESRIFDFASYAFDMAVHNAFGALGTGACLCVPSEEGRRGNLVATMRSMKVTVADVTSSVARLIDPDSLPDLETIILGGEALSVDDVNRWWGKARVVNIYGPAETHITTVNADAPTPELATRLGRGIGLATWIVDPNNHNRLLPPGCVGELLLEGPLVGKGYLNDPKRTETSFVNDPAWLIRGAPGHRGRRGRLYKSGDLVRYDAEGRLAYVSRKDNQVKLRGQRIELGEIEHQVQECVTEATQVVSEIIAPSGANTKSVVAVFIQFGQDGSGSSTTADILSVDPETVANISRRLPRYMVPSVFFRIRSFQKTPSGKINRILLRQIGASFSAQQLAESASLSLGPIRNPVTHVEHRMQGIWARVLNIDPSIISLDGDFFQLGGDSIAAMKLVAEARKVGIGLTVADVFRHPTLEHSAAHAVLGAGSKHLDTILPFTLLGDQAQAQELLQDVAFRLNMDISRIHDAYPATPLQQGLFSLSLKRSGDYVMQSILELYPETDIDKFQQAWQKVAETFPILRTRMMQSDDHGLLQIVCDDPPQWNKVIGLDEYLKADRAESMGLGEPLTRYALVQDMATPSKMWFIWTVHHVLYDGWSEPLITSAVNQAYQGITTDSGPQFRTFIKYVKEQDGNRSRQYWESALADCEAVTFPALPPSIKEPMADSFVEHLLPRPHGSHHGATISTLIRAAWGLVACGMTNAEDVVFGATVSGRNAPVDGIGEIVGPTFATVPIRVKLAAAGETVGSYLDKVQQQATDMIPYEQMGLHHIAKISTSTQRACGFQTLLVIQPQSDSGNDAKVLGKLREGNQHQWFNTFGLTLVAEIGISIKVKASFDSRVIEPWVVRNLLQQLAVVMEQLDGCEAGRSLKTVSRVSYQDLSTMWEWNKTPTKPANKSISELIRDQSRAQPDSIAVDAWDGSLTYHHLDQLSTNMACYLVKRGLRRGDFVLICTEKSKWATVSILALAKTEAAFVLLDPSLPLQRLKSISRQVQAKLAISSLQYKTLSLQLCQDVLTVSSSLFVKLPTESCEDLPTLDLDSAIYVVFTSGTTGTPKGAVIHHRSSATAVMNQVKGFGYNTETRLYDFSTYSFDGSILNAFTVLYGGGTLCVPTDDGRKSSLAESMESLKANTVFLTPSVANIMSPREVPHLKTMILGGEAIRVEDVQPWWDFVKVFTIYGPSECTPVSLINPSPSTPEEALRLGWGAGQTSWVVDSENHDVLAPLGCVGELLLEGPLVGAGYFQEPEKTASAFITDPEWLIKGYGHLTGRRGRLYKTGDLVRYNMDGSLSYVSRKDDQVKIHGSRVELGEVEHQVRNCVPLSTQVVAEVITPSSKRSEPILAAFVQVADEADPTSACRVLPNTPDIQHQLSQLLPAYMIPSVVFAMKQLPMGTTGKMNRKELRKIGSAFTAQDLAKLKANTEIEKRDATTPQQKKIQEIWARVLGVDARMVGIDDSFFQLGGDSITAMRFVGEMRKAGLQLTVADVFRSPQLYKLANQATTGGTDIKTIKPTKLQGPVEQSFAQGRLWFLEQLYPGLTWYLMPCIMSLRGPLHLEALNVAFRALEQRHETLRTTLSTKNGVNLQHIHPVRGCDLRIVALSPDDEKTIADHLHRDETTPFDLSKEPGWRVTLYKLGENHHILSIILHHIFSDGWSVDIFRREMAEFYSAAMAGKDPLSLATPLPVQYRDFSLFQREQTQLEHHDRQLEYWVRQLENSQPAELPCDKHRPSTLSGIADLQTFRIQGSLYKSLQAFCKKHEVTPFIALLTAFRATHYRLTGESDVLIGSPNANRDSADLKDVIGFFVNMQCLRLVVEDETVSFLDLMKRTQSAVTASFQNQDVPFESLVSRLRKERDLSRHPLVQIVFALHSQRDLGKFTLEGLDAEYIDQSITTRFDLEFHFFHEEDGLRGDLIYSTDLFQPVTMKNTLTIFTKLLEGSLENPETPVALLSLMTEGGLAQMNKLDMLEIQKTDYPRDSTIVTEFRKQVLKCSDKVAVKDLSMQLTYRELDDKSDKLANWLQNRRYAPESLVGVLVDRSCFAVVAFIGILKANLAYLPFDLKTPTNRMRSMLLSVPGHKLILVGPGAKLPAIDLPDVEHMGIVEALEQAQQIDTAMDVNCTPNHRQPSSSSLAYVMFTSGSTGNPKGVLVEHGNILRLCKENAVNGFDTTGIIASMSNVAFDAVTWEVYTALLNGGTLVCLDYFTVLDFDAVGRIFRQEDIRAIFITPALLKQYLSRCPSAIASLELLFIGGDKLDPKDILVARDLLGQNGKITAVYGPTENTGFSTFYPLPNEDECVNGVSIGRSISNSGAYVMDSQQQLVPIGVVGELIVTGDGVARGYTDAARTAERFIEVEVNGKQVKAYRTGDYVRARPTDGQLDYIRRMDGQVKIRGQRLELGEVEHVLKSHASVNDAAVILHQPKDEQAQLISFATLDEKKIQTQITDLELPPGTDDERQPGDDSDVEKQVKVWEESFETDIYETIGDLRPEQVGRDFVGWISMYDGAEIDKGEMNEWLDDTIATMINGGESGHVLELGSGTGMILFNLINTGLRSYVGLDPSQKAVDFVARSAMKSPELASKVHMYKGTAADLSHLDEPICPDLVVVNSVAQYFPGQQYTLNVIKDILALKGSGAKTMFFGDMRSYALYDQFRVTRALHRVGRKPGKNEVRQQMKDMEEMEVEYLVAPAFFTSLPTLLPDLVEHVEILPKKMKGTNELSCYRYAAVVHARHTGKSLSIHQVHPSSWVDFQKEELDAMSLFEHLRRATASSVVAVGNIPYSKTIFERQVLSSLRCEDEGSANTGHWLLEARQKSEKCPSLDAISLTKIAERAGWQVEISWARQYSQQGGLDAIFHRKQPANMGHARVLFQFPTDHDDLPVGTQLSSQPLRQQVKQRIRAQLHDRLQTSLPPYMIPRVINFLDRLPINENGKVDRRALAQSVQARTATRSSLVRQPVSDNERRLQKIWAQVLNIEQHTIGLDDSFFQVGGDSLAAMKLVGEARRSGISINVADIFRRPTLQEMSCFETGSAAQGPSASIPRVETSGPVEQSFAQGRLWFMEQLYPGLTWYLMPFAIRINGDVSVPALNTALHAIELRHDTLRTTFASRQDVNIQEVHRFQPKELKIVDVADEQELSDALRQDQTTPIRLGVEAGWRVRLLRLDPTRHILSIVMHHIISDGWSTDVLQKELSAFYSAALKAWSSELDSDKVLTSTVCALPPLPIQYTDFSIWQRQPEQLAEHRKQLEYWVGQLETSQPAELLCDKPRPKTLSGAAAVASLTIDGALYGQLEQFCNVNGVTKFVALLAAFRITHLHLTGSVDASIGTVNANRARSEVKDMIGFFVNMQCLRIPIQDESFSELVKQVHKITVDSLSAQDVPFENLVSSLQRDRDLSRHPLVQLVFAFHSQMDLGDFTLEGLETETIAVPPTTRFDLEFHLFQQHDSLQGEVLYSTDLFDETTMKNMLSVFRTVLETGLQDPTLPVTSLPLLSDEDFRVLDDMKLIEMDRIDYPRDDDLASLFRRQAAITPKNIAVKDPAGQLTYSELDQKSDSLASWLVQQDLAPETLVGIFSARSCKTIIAMLGIVKAGLAYLPFDLKIPKARMETILSSIEGQKIILYGSNVEQVPVSDRADIELISIDETLSGQANPVGLCTAPTSATSLAYVTFTSGSTGKPKGVMVEHRGVVRLVKESNMMQHLPPKPVMAHVTNTAFDVAGFEIYGALLNGGTLVCIDSVMVLDFRIVSDIFKKEVIDAAIFAPALLKQYLAECPAALQNLKAIYVAGDRADVDDLFAARELIKGPVVNAYGPTENSVISTLYQLQDGERCVNGVPIGESISNSGAYVLDRNQRLVPLGVVGELVVTGDGIARGYTDPERNTGRFVEITIGTEKHRAYRTGDVVRRRPCDGQIEFFGRMDGQVKLRGHRVELGEIEHSLRTHEDVNEAVVVLHKEEGKEDQLNGFVTVRQAASQQQGPGEVDVEGHVDVWEQIFDSETYGGLDKLDANEIGRDFAGWISMYDGKDIDKEEMNEWLDETISTILNGDRPRNVLELGTGSGMVLFNLGDGLDSYIGLEPSIRAVHFTRRAANSLPGLAEKVHIFQGTAADIATLPCPVAPNLVIINSVAQYFPSQDYLQKVIDDCVGLKGVETIIFGDMRSHAMRKEFQASKAMFSLGDTATREEIQSKMAEVDRAEQELLVDPGFFSALVKRMPHLISHVEIVPKKMKATNELSCFRYAAVLHVKGSEPLNVHEVNGSEWIDFAKERLNRDLLLETLEASSHLPAVAISNIPYRKTIAERFVVKALEDGGDQVNWIVSARREAQQCPSMDACDLSELAESVGYKVELSWARQFTQRGGIDAIFHRHESPKGRNRTLFRFPTDDQDRPSHLMTSVPLRQQLNQRIQEELFERLKALLPPYMVPSVITILDNMPINDNGKVDRRALGERVKAQIKATRATVSEQPSTNTELSMQAIWAKVLNLEAATIGIHDKFFHLGGHSITAMKVVAEARRVGLEVAVADVLVHDTIHTLSLHCSTLEDDEEKEEVLSNVILVDEGARTRLLNGVKSLEVGVDVDLHEVEDILPLTSFQEKIILDGKKVGQHANYFHLDLGTNIDVPRLQESCARTMTRFSILRARFLHLEQHYWQVVLRNPDVPFHVIEVEGEEDMGQAFHSFCLKDLSQLRSTDLPLSFVLLKHKIQGLRLIIRLSHCQYDGISFPLIFQSLMESYRGFDLPPEPAFRRYLAYATLQRERSISYWKKILQGSSPTQIEPRILPPASWRTAPAKRIYRHAEMGLPSLPSKTTSAALVSAAWALLLSRITQQTDVVLGHVVAGRNASLSGLDETVGMCLNIIPIRAKLSSHQSSEDLLLGIQNQFAALGEADSLGFKDIIEHCTEWPAGSSFETVIQHQNIDERPTLEGSGGGEAQVSFFDNSHMVPPSLFIVSYPRAGKRLEIKLFANDHVITNKGADALLKSLCQVSERFGVSPQEPLESCMEAVDLDGLTHE